MTEQFVNKYVVVLGHCGLGGTDYEIHATPENLLLLSDQLREKVTQFQNGSHPFLESMKRAELEYRENDPFPVLTEYVTLSQERTDRMCISFVAEKSLDEHHIMKPAQITAETLSLSLAKFCWYFMFPIIGIVACTWAFGRYVLGINL